MARKKCKRPPARSGAEICNELIDAAAEGYPPPEIQLERMIEIFIECGPKDDAASRQHLREFGYSFPAFGPIRADDFVMLHSRRDAVSIRYSMAAAIMIEAHTQRSLVLPLLRAAVGSDELDWENVEGRGLSNLIVACRAGLDVLAPADNFGNAA